MKWISDEPVRNDLLRLYLDTLEHAIAATEQEYFSMRQAHAISRSYRPPRRQETGGPEPIGLCYAESKRSRSSNYKRLKKCNCFQKLGNSAYGCIAPRPILNSTDRNNQPFSKKGNGRRSKALLQNRNSEVDPSGNGRGQ